MKDEIKEILDDIKELIEEDETPENMKKYVGGTFNINELKILLDYITNLQEENRQTKLLKERYQLEKEVYKSRNEKTIEMLKQNGFGLGYVEVADLINILEGE